MTWHYNGKEYHDKHNESLYGFVYVIHFENDVGDLYKYYGKKKWFSERKKHYGKKKLAQMTDKRRRTYEYIKKDNDWKEYVGSCKETYGLIPIHKEIICFASTQRELTYMETKVLFTRGALEDKFCLNANILGKFFRDNLY